MRRCACLLASIRERALARIPPEYQGLTLATVAPDAQRNRFQPELWAAMRAQPENSYLLIGPNGCGKTLAGWLLYRAAVEAGRPATGLSCTDLITQFRAWELDGTRAPVIEPDDLTSGERRLIFLDEIDKARPTEFAGEVLFRLLDTAYAYQHQIVVTSNTTLEGLAVHWSRQNATYGPSIVRRLAEIDGATLVEMFDEKEQ